MGRRSSIEKLPDEIVKGINAKLADGFTLDQIMAWIEEIGLEDDAPSRSALGRYKIHHDSLSSELKNARMIAETIVREASDTGLDSQMGRVGVEMVQSLIMKMTAARVNGRFPDFDPQEMHYLARTLKDSMSALDIDDKRRAKIREEALKEAAASVQTVVKARGLTPETANEIRQKILGVGA